MDNKYKNLGINTILVFIGKLGSGLITFLMLPLYTKWLAPDEFGLAELINTYANILISIATCCMADAIFIFPKTSNDIGKSKYYSSGFFISSVGVLLSFIFAIILKCDYFGFLGSAHDNSIEIVTLSCCLFLQNYTQQFTRSIDKMKVYSVCGIVQTFSIAIFSFLLIPYFGCKGYIYSMACASIIAALYTMIASKSYVYISIKHLDVSYMLDLLKYGMPLIPNSIMWWLVDGINKPIMEAELGLSMIGIYTVASKFPSVLNIITGAFSNAWGISVTEEYGTQNFNAFFNEVFKLVFFVLMLFSFLMTALSDFIIDIFTSGKYSEASNLLPILLLSVMLSNTSGLFGGIFMAKKQSKYFFYSSIYGAITSLLFTLVLVKISGVYGVAWASALSFLIMSIARAFFVWKDISNINIMYYMASIMLYVAFVILKISDLGMLQYILLPILFVLYLTLNKSNVIFIYSKISSYIK